MIINNLTISLINLEIGASQLGYPNKFLSGYDTKCFEVTLVCASPRNLSLSG